ncbi:VOC family protein [Halorubrum sp. DTA98]|uniref:VOC family protein n=1 Tax=Halorubrum sp. DTA98 TaxID=3402163 RepID=UPI003AABD6EF
MTAELPGSTRVGRVALRVADLDRVVSFYVDVVGLAVLERADDSVVLGVGDTPLLTLIDAPDAPDRGEHEAGLFHVAVRVPSRAALGRALDRFESRWRLTGASDHLVSEALYARDPEGNGVEVYRDRPRSAWPDAPDGRVAMDTLPLDREAVRAAASDADGTESDPADRSGEAADGLPDGTDVGHVHLEATDLDAERSFYTDLVGLRIRQEFGSDATFLAAGDYHHHVGVNVWNRRRDPAGGGLGIAWYELVLPPNALADVRERLGRSDAAVEAVDGDSDAFETHDPSGIRVRFRADDTDGTDGTDDR